LIPLPCLRPFFWKLFILSRISPGYPFNF
jgi:hypothetical protein